MQRQELVEFVLTCINNSHYNNNLVAERDCVSNVQLYVKCTFMKKFVKCGRKILSNFEFPIY